MTGGSPAAIIAGKLTNEPPPAIAFIVPASRSCGGKQSGVLHAGRLHGPLLADNRARFGAGRSDWP